MKERPNEMGLFGERALRSGSEDVQRALQCLRTTLCDSATAAPLPAN